MAASKIVNIIAMEKALTLDFDEFNPMNVTELPPIIFLHGYLWNRKIFKGIVEILCKRTGRKVYSLDLRNHGSSPRTLDFPGPESNAPDLKKFMQDHAIDKASFVCHSYSSVGAHILAMDNPKAVEKIVMVDHLPDCSSYVKNGVAFTRKMVNSQNKILCFLRKDMSLLQAKSKITKLGEGSPGDVAFMRKVAHDLTKENGNFKWTIDLDFLLQSVEKMKFYVQPEVTYQGEILIIRSADSILVLDEFLERSFRLNPRMRVKTYEKVGHMLMFEEQEKFLDDVVEFLKND